MGDLLRLLAAEVKDCADDCVLRYILLNLAPEKKNTVLNLSNTICPFRRNLTTPALNWQTAQKYEKTKEQHQNDYYWGSMSKFVNRNFETFFTHLGYSKQINNYFFESNMTQKHKKTKNI